jgi:hypothetical protein
MTAVISDTSPGLCGETAPRVRYAGDQAMADVSPSNGQCVTCCPALSEGLAVVCSRTETTLARAQITDARDGPAAAIALPWMPNEHAGFHTEGANMQARAAASARDPRRRADLRHHQSPPGFRSRAAG